MMSVRFIQEYHWMTELLNEREAALFCGLDFNYFRNLRKTKQGPTFIRPSPHTTMYRKSDLESWVASWKVTEPTLKETK
jgi:hypothetical protein